METYPGKVRIVYRPYIVHADVAVAPAMGVCAADKQGKFMEMSDLVWTKAFAERDLGEEKITALASTLGLDMARYAQDAGSEECMKSLQASVENFTALGVNGTPTFYINGRTLVGAQPFEAFKQLIDEELAKADKAVAAGTPAADYYRKVVLEGGQKSLQ
jgi:protein-disulfide isomerase